MVSGLLELTSGRSYDLATIQPGDLKPCSSISITVTSAQWDGGQPLSPRATKQWSGWPHITESHPESNLCAFLRGSSGPH